MSSFFLLEEFEQYEFLAQRGIVSDKDLLAVCNDACHQALDAKGISHLYLDEERIKSLWMEINSWAQVTSLNWSLAPVFSGRFLVEGVDMADLVFHATNYHLVWFLKVHFLLKDAIDQSIRETSFVVIRSENEGEFRRSENFVFQQLLISRGIHFRTIRTKIRRAKKLEVKEVARFCAAVLLGLFRSRFDAFEIVASGGLRHLAPILTQFTNKRILILGRSFQKKEAEECKRNNWGYVTELSFITPLRCLKIWTVRRSLNRVLSALRPTPETTAPFLFEGMEVPGLCEGVFAFLKDVMLRKVTDVVLFFTFLKKIRARVLILDEDRSGHRHMARLWERAGKESFVISHGLPATVFNVESKTTRAGVAKTIVNSEYEKKMYLARGFANEKLQVLGVPRFDRLAGIPSSQHICRADKDIRVFCLPQRILAKGKGYLGLHRYLSGSATRENLRALVDAVAGLGAQLVIKTHYDAGQDELEAFVKSSGYARVFIEDHLADLYSLMNEVDVVVTGFSTVVIESIMRGLPVIVLNLSRLPHVHPFAERGVVRIIEDVSELKKALRELALEGPPRAAMLRAQKENFSYFCGFHDGRNAGRVARFIEQEGGL